MKRQRSVEERLQLFCARVDKTLSRRAIRDQTIRASFRLRWDRDGTTFTHDSGDEDDVRSLMADIRMFLGHSGPPRDVAFEAIANLLENRLRDDELRSANRANRQAWRQAKRGAWEMVIDGRKYTAEGFFNLITNADVFHTDFDKESEWERLNPMIQAMAQQMASSMVIDCIRVLVAQRNVVRKALADGVLDLAA